MSYAKIADRARLSVNEVARHMARAISKLAKQMDGHRLDWWERQF